MAAMKQSSSFAGQLVAVLLLSCITILPCSSPSASRRPQARPHSHNVGVGKPEHLRLRGISPERADQSFEPSCSQESEDDDEQPEDMEKTYRKFYKSLLAGIDDDEEFHDKNTTAQKGKKATRNGGQLVGGDGQDDEDEEDDDDPMKYYLPATLADRIPRIPEKVVEQMSEADWRDVYRLLNLHPKEDMNITVPEALDRMQGRSRLMTEYLRQRLVRLDDGRLQPVPELYPEIFERIDEVGVIAIMTYDMILLSMQERK
jgi:hypothetical protein